MINILRSTELDEPLGIQLNIKGTLADSATGLAATDIERVKGGGEKPYKFFYIRIDSATGTGGIMTITNLNGDTINDVPYNILDEWYPEPILAIQIDATNTVKGIIYATVA